MIVPNKNCTACGACIQKCPKSCISMQEDENGFLYPQVNLEKCIGCGLCDKVCHLNVDMRNEETTTAAACVHRDEQILLNSTSGGAFTAIAEYIINIGGVIYGCAYSTPTQAIHMRIESIGELQKLRGSKYVQSAINNTYHQAQCDLQKGKWVLFSGTPCQIAGLKAFLGKSYETLITADVICHGVPSSAYFKKFIDGYESKNNCKVVEFDFRSKKNTGWSSVGICRIVKNKRVQIRKAYYFDEYYYYYFLKGMICRDCCYECKYANLRRPGDFTLGDFWGAEGQNLGFNLRNGCSLVLLNTEKAKKLFRELNLKNAPVNLAFAAANNHQLREPCKRTELREELLREYRECSADETQKFFKKHFRLARIKAMAIYAIPYSIRLFLLKCLYAIQK